MKGRRIIAVHGIRNKGQTIPAHDLDIAEKRMRDWNDAARAKTGAPADAAMDAKNLDLSASCALTSPQPADTYRPLFGRR